MKKKVDTQELVTKLEKLIRTRMADQDVVSLDSFRDFKKKSDPKHVLLIEDDETMRAALKRILEHDGLIVQVAADGTELTVLLNEFTPDLILLDIGLPWVNGFELGQLLKDHQDLKKIPLVFISGKTSDEDVRKAFEIGADEFIKKPFEVEKLRKVIQDLLKIS